MPLSYRSAAYSALTLSTRMWTSSPLASTTASTGVVRSSGSTDFLEIPATQAPASSGAFLLSPDIVAVSHAISEALSRTMFPTWAFHEERFCDERCPPGVNRVGLAAGRPFPVYPDIQTFSDPVGISQTRHSGPTHDEPSGVAGSACEISPYPRARSSSRSLSECCGRARPAPLRPL